MANCAFCDEPGATTTAIEDGEIIALCSTCADIVARDVRLVQPTGRGCTTAANAYRAAGMNRAAKRVTVRRRGWLGRLLRGGR
jgi:hypothetical protein